jgi:hypothetical protein
MSFARQPPLSRALSITVVDLIMSGGQTGADRAALDVAIRHHIPHGGWCPAGRCAEDGPIHRRYELTETPEAAYAQRTAWNVRDSDGTVVLTLKPHATGGSLYALTVAAELCRPVIHLSRTASGTAKALRQFIAVHHIRRLNVAGSRESTEPGIYAWACALLEEAMFMDAADAPPPELG